MRKTLFAVFIAGALFLALGGGEALAAFCIVAGKPVGKGSAVFVDLSTDPETVTITNPSGQPHGGFATLDFDGDGIGDVDVFFLPVTPALQDPEEIGVGELPHKAHNAGPGDDSCDGIGVDDLAECP